MVENIIVVGIVGGSLALVARSLYRAVAGKGEGCGCGAACPVSPGTAGPLLQITADAPAAGGGT